MTKEYTDKFALSQSSIKDWKNNSPFFWKKMWIDKTVPRPQSVVTELGSFLDILCFTPEEVNKKYIVCDMVFPSENIQKVVKGVYDHIVKLNKNAVDLNAQGQNIPMKEFILEDYIELIKTLSVKNEFYAKNPDTAVTKITKENPKAYFEHLVKAGNKKVISKSVQDTAIELKTILFDHKTSKQYFRPTTNVDIIFQQQIFVDKEVEGVEGIDVIPMKGALDIFRLNHKQKVAQEVDLKYTNNAYLFGLVVKMFDYPLQHSLYDFLLREWLKTYKGGKYKDYTIASPLNVVIDDVEKIPYIYRYKHDDLYIKRFGIEGTPFKGWEDTVREIAWHISTDQWQWPKEHYLNNCITLNIFNKK